jgi:hypothetical protein
MAVHLQRGAQVLEGFIALVRRCECFATRRIEVSACFDEGGTHEIEGFRQVSDGIVIFAQRSVAERAS